MRDITMGGGQEEYIFCLEDSQAVPTCPFGRSKAFDQNYLTFNSMALGGLQLSGI
jgi:hypothetical protein